MSRPLDLTASTDAPGSTYTLRDLESRLAFMVTSIKDYAIFILDEEGRVRSWNAGAKAIKGYEADEIIGRHISTFYLPEDRAAGRPNRLLDIAAKDGRVEDEGYRLKKDGTPFWADVVITAARDETGRLVGFAKVTRDLTARKQADEALRQSEERFRLLVQSVRDYAIFMLDPSGRVATWNAGAERLKGYLPEEIIGQHFSRFYPPDAGTMARCEHELVVALEQGKFEEEGWRIRKDGSRFWASVVIEPVRHWNGELRGFAKVTRDLTDRKLAEEERRRLLQAEEAVRLRDEFLSIASHELKTPLSAVQLQLEGLLTRAEPLTGKTRDKVERAYKGASRLAELVETLLDVSRLATGRFTLRYTRFDLGHCVHDVVERFREHTERAGCTVSVRVHGPAFGEWDRIRLEQVVTNVLTNATKYATGTPIEIEIQPGDPSHRLTITDAGPGVPASEWPRIFGRFERAASIRHYGGLGLGLYVSRQICEAHGGDISVEAAVPRGARFVITLPSRVKPEAFVEPQSLEQAS